ncbi:alpha-galactosidase [Zychaea mexicana]|uniref:alpha-galactosidase n=1 Tax=Zychaea mexicana TaxID=64656 RepID=UPI0022FE4209|nr:alpha-galactosidase [Zychaea mexicana]KAI9490686.1 alpha-galactosidase [Zychaea mexicana]
MVLSSKAIFLGFAIVTTTFFNGCLAAGLNVGIHKHESLDTWFLVTERSSYVISAAANGYLVNMHWGRRLTHLDDLNATVVEPPIWSQIIPVTEAREELPVFGGLRYREAVLKAELPDGVRELNLQFAGNANISSDHGGTRLDLDLRDANRTELLVTLHYEIDVENDIIRRSYTVRNGLDGRVNLSKAFSAAWHLPYALGWDEHRELVTLAGEWAQEAMVETTRLAPGVKHTVESTRGLSDHVSQPYFALAQVPNAVNPSTEVYFGALAWTGSWEITVHTDTKGYVRVAGGIHHQDFGWTLEPGESFTTPVFAAGFTDEGLPGARLRMPRHARKIQKRNLLTQKDDDVYHPVLYNSWEAVAFDLTFEKQMELADKAAPLGVELFVVDDGWFGGRSSDTAGLGDWFTNKTKFPGGMKPLADHVHDLGMKFGLWFEMEMVNPDSDLYREHPDWVFYYEGVPRYLSRTQLVLNFGLKEVRDYMYEQAAAHIEEAGIDYIKWDFNRPMQGVTMHDYDRNPKEAWVLAVEGYYEIIARLKERFPHLWFESCSSGGGRMDLGAIERTDQIWTSDNTRPDARLFIQYGASLWVPPRSMYGWVTDSSSDANIEVPLSFRFHTSFMGGLGIGSNINEFSEEQLTEATHWIALYKKMRHVIQNGNLDWLVPPTRVGELVAATQSTYKQEEAVILAFRLNSPYPASGELSPIRARYLDENATYRVTIWQEDPENPVDEYEMSGALLMYRGLELPGLNEGMFKSAVVWLQQA